MKKDHKKFTARTLILDNFDSFTYNIFQYVAELGGNPRVFRNNEISLKQIERGIKNGEFTHIIISPGPGSPDKKKDFGVCGDVIKKLKGKVPILGVCLGHQGIIYHLGGKVIRAPEPVHGKRSKIFLDTTNVLFKGFPKTIEAMRYHSLIGAADSLPKSLNVIARTADNLIMAVSLEGTKYSHQPGFAPLLGIQFHPESIGTPTGKKMLQNFLAIKAFHP